ncbi:guanine nucleotide exchange factor VAV3 [Trichonephila clavata]|uniref:Guanine nucleotide exchange factor VAV3 n=2 Tax=Trichonephila clavata TaxID=2740835 RepID=A0A8X6HFD8_TRICU|nr:guanine nucleotide exchange factor VAV3 [Trichonephila clavata]
MAEILWRECAEWLIKQQVILPDHRVTWPSAQVLDLVYTLRDGVVLCQLLNKLVAGCIDLKEISLRPQMSQFLCLKNIRTFLQTCQNVFDISPSDLFEPSMLFDCTDFGKVLHTLSVLSKSEKAQASGIKGFPSFAKNHDYYNDDIYRNLEELANERDYAANAEQPYTLADEEREEAYDVYEDIIQYKPSKNVSASHVHPVEKRDYCIKELIETEKNYIEALNMIIKHFMRPLKNTLVADVRKVIFMNIEELAEIHTGFHSELYKACTSSQYKISECFLHWKDKFIIYGEYCSKLPAAQERVEDLSNKSEVINQAILRCQQEANGGKFKLRDLLSVPMQRILKYHLLLKELIRNTPKTHEDYFGLQKALDAMLDLAQYINEVKRDNETLQIIRDIQASITDLRMPEDLELKDYGRLLKDGELKIRSHDDNRLKNRYVFIFDKVMLMCKSTRGEQYSFKEALVLLDYKVEDVASSVRVGSRDKWSYFWLLAHRQNKTALTMYAKTEEMKQKWIDAIEKALDNVCPAALRTTDHIFQMHSFEKPANCTECDKLLRGIFYQGYLCSVCGVAVHKDCIEDVRSCGAPRLPPRPPSVTVVPEILRRNLTSAGRKPYMFKVRARFAYQGPPDHLSFDSDDEIYVTNKLNNMCWEGYVARTGKTGFFPPDHVEKRPPSYENPFPSPNPNAVENATLAPDYINTMLEGHDWFAGVMERDVATKKLEELPSGTFLLRISPKQNGSYAISINYQNQVKHMRVCTSDNGQHFYLSETKYFKSIVELVNWYKENSLSESFNGLHVTLMIPYKKALAGLNNESILGYAEALYDFQGNSPNMLTLHKGDRIIILSKAGNQKGWWKGQIGENVGYFPYLYVKEIFD